MSGVTEADNLTEIIEDCSLEWNKERGVLYVHNKATGHTVLRICRLPTSQISLHNSIAMIDITLGKEMLVNLTVSRDRANEESKKTTD